MTAGDFYFWFDKHRIEIINSNKEMYMAPKTDQLNKMIAKAEEQILHCQEQLAADPPPDEATAAALMTTIDDMLAKIERLQGQQARLDAIKKAKK